MRCKAGKFGFVHIHHGFRFAPPETKQSDAIRAMSFSLEYGPIGTPPVDRRSLPFDPASTACLGRAIPARARALPGQGKRYLEIRLRNPFALYIVCRCRETGDMDLKQFIRDIPDFPKPGILFKDITPLIKDGKAFHHTIDQLAQRYQDKKLDKVVGIESRGFIFASALAYRLGIGMVPIRKVGKLPAKCVRETYDLEYGTDSIEIHEDAISAGDRILVIDDVIATGGTLAATCSLVKRLGGTIVEAATVIEITFLPGREKLGQCPFFTLLQF